MLADQSEIKALIDLLARLPGLGPVSSRRIVLHLIRLKGNRMADVASAMQRVADNVRECSDCGNFCSTLKCEICNSAERLNGQICVVQDVADLWAMERSAAFKGKYHVLGGVLSMLQGMGPEDLRIPDLVERAGDAGVEEVILALSATVDGQTTAHYIADQLSGTGARVTSLGRGVPIGGELDFLDDGTIAAALSGRRDY